MKMKMDAIKLKDSYYTNHMPYRVRLHITNEKPSHINIFGFENIPVTASNTIKDQDGEYIIITVQGSTLSKYLNPKFLVKLQTTKTNTWVYIGEHNEPTRS